MRISGLPIREAITDEATGIINRLWTRFFQNVEKEINDSVTGPASSTASNLAEFSDTTGLVLKDGGLTHDDTADAIAKKHDRVHAINSADDHTSSITEEYMLKADENGLPAQATNTDAEVAAAVAANHTRLHAITSTSDHSSTATSGKMLKANANGLPVDATNTDAEVAAVVALYTGAQILTDENVVCYEGNVVTWEENVVYA